MAGKQVVFSGIQPSGDLHLGNYIGAIGQWVELQDKNLKIREKNQRIKTRVKLMENKPKPSLAENEEKNEFIFCIVDLHAITVPQNPRGLREKILEVAALYLACGIDPKKSKIFIQSENPHHPYLAWIFDCFLPMGWLNRMTQFKQKSQKEKRATSVGLFNYPALMAADILLYDTDLVPVGEDQLQHIELTRDIAQRFNKDYGPIFKSPKPLVDRQAARIMSLQDPLSKMSKSDNNPLGRINLLDPADEIMRKIKKAVTDSGSDIIYNREKKPAISNLMVIYSKFTEQSVDKIEEQYAGKNYSQFKKDLSEVIIERLVPIQKKYYRLRKEERYLNQVLDEGRDFALSLSQKKLNQVKKVIGLGRD